MDEMEAAVDTQRHAVEAAQRIAADTRDRQSSSVQELQMSLIKCAPLPLLAPGAPVACLGFIPAALPSRAWTGGRTVVVPQRVLRQPNQHHCFFFHLCVLQYNAVLPTASKHVHAALTGVWQRAKPAYVTTSPTTDTEHTLNSFCRRQEQLTAEMRMKLNAVEGRVEAHITAQEDLQLKARPLHRVVLALRAS